MKIQTLLPATIVAIAVVVVLVATPQAIRSLSQAKVDAEVVAARSRLTRSNALEEVNQATRDIAKIVEPSVLSLSASGSQKGRAGGSQVSTGSAWIYDVRCLHRAIHVGHIHARAVPQGGRVEPLAAERVRVGRLNRNAPA